MPFRNMSVKRPAVFNTNLYPKDRIYDFHDNEYIDIIWSIIQTGILRFEWSKRKNIRYSWYEESTDHRIDEDRNKESEWDFAHSLGTWGFYNIRDLQTNNLLFTDNIKGNNQPAPKTHLNPGSFAIGNNPPVYVPEARHYTIIKPGNNVEGALGHEYPYRLHIPKYSDPIQKYKDVKVFWSLNLVSLFDGKRWEMGNNGGQQFTLFQKAVSITKYQGEILDVGSINFKTNQVLVLDKSDNRGDAVESKWIISKKDINNNWINASLGTDYIFVMSTNENSDIVQIKFNLSGEYRVNNSTKGNTNSIAGINEMNRYTFINVSDVLIKTKIEEDIIFPTIEVSLLHNNSWDNVMKNSKTPTTPLTGYEPYKTDLSPILNKEGSKFIKTTYYYDEETEELIPPIKVENLILTDEQWLIAILARANVIAFSKDKETDTFKTVINCNEQNTWFHTFTEAEGKYEIGYQITPKIN